MSGRVRAACLVAVLVIAHQVVSGHQPRYMALRRPLAALPLAFDEWQGVPLAELDSDTRRLLGADEYLNRAYVHPSGRAAGLYVAYYGSQQQGDAIHSPLHCLPGNGWQPVSHERVALDGDQGTSPAMVNRYVVERRGAQQLVLYWFQGRGRVIASEYTNKAYLLFDALRTQRSDEALVRIVAPVVQGQEEAARTANELARRVLPALDTWLP